MKTGHEFDAIVIGSGQGGNPLSMALAGAGMRTVLIEREHVGGTCINEGCTPTKTMVASARVAYLARRGADYGVRTGEIGIVMERVRQRKREIVDSFRNGSQGRIAKTKNLELIFGEARFMGKKTVAVKSKDGSERELNGEKIFINAGGRPSVPGIKGLEEVSFLNSTTIMELDRVPEHLVVLGGGYVGLEFGQMFRRFGSRVTIIQSGGQLLGREDEDVAEAVAGILKEEGIEVLLEGRAEEVKREGTKIQVGVRKGEDLRMVEGTDLLVATGRTANTDTLNVAAAGIATDKHGFIHVNGKLETSAEGIFALGDIKGGPAFTHISYDDFRILRTNVIEKRMASTEGRMVPYTVFMDPQLGRVGMTEAEARASGRKIRVAKMPMNYVARALEMDEARGFMKAIVDGESEEILGAAVLGVEGGEVMSMLQVAMMGKLKYSELRDGVFAHPTLAESLNNLFGHFEG